MKSARLHAFAVTALAAGVALIVFTIGVLGNPFGTNFRVGPYAFEMTLDSIQESGSQ
jgi:hypothetical protein